MSRHSGMKRDEGVSIGPNLRNRRIYPDTEIFASMLSTITRRTSSRERRAIFQATAGYVYTRAHIYTRARARAHELETHTCARARTREKTSSLCWHSWVEHLPGAIRSRARARMCVRVCVCVCAAAIAFTNSCEICRTSILSVMLVLMQIGCRVEFVPLIKLLD